MWFLRDASVRNTLPSGTREDASDPTRPARARGPMLGAGRASPLHGPVRLEPRGRLPVRTGLRVAALDLVDHGHGRRRAQAHHLYRTRRIGHGVAAGPRRAARL